MHSQLTAQFMPKILAPSSHRCNSSPFAGKGELFYAFELQPFLLVIHHEVVIRREKLFLHMPSSVLFICILWKLHGNIYGGGVKPPLTFIDQVHIFLEWYEIRNFKKTSSLPLPLWLKLKGHFRHLVITVILCGLNEQL